MLSRLPAVRQSHPAIEAAVKRIFTPHLISKIQIKNKPVHEKFILGWRRLMMRLLPLGGSSFGNRVTIYNEGDDAFRAMWDAIDKAEKRVWMETYIFVADNIGRTTLSKLTDAAKRGCDVVLLYDKLGSLTLSDTYLRALRDAGGRTEAFNPWRPWHIGTHPLHRTHRKILVTDGNVGFCGGMNVSGDYAGLATGGTGYFRDTHVRVEGHAAHDLTSVFLGSIKEHSQPLAETLYKLLHAQKDPAAATRKRWRDRVLSETALRDMLKSVAPAEVLKHGAAALDKLSTELRRDTHRAPAVEDPMTSPQSEKLGTNAEVSEGVFVQVLPSNERRKLRHIQSALRLTLRHAQSHCFFTTPYFVPPVLLHHAIIQAARRGVDVRILTAGKSDIPLVRLASQHIYDSFLSAGVRIFELQGRALHAKTVTIDSIYGNVGSFNLDYLSGHSNLEVCLTVLDPELATKLEAQFHSDLEAAVEITKESLAKRSTAQKVLHWLSFQFYALSRFAWN